MDDAIEVFIKSLKDNEVGNTIAEYVRYAKSLDPKCRKLVLSKALELAREYGAI